VEGRPPPQVPAVDPFSELKLIEEVLAWSGILFGRQGRDSDCAVSNLREARHAEFDGDLAPLDCVVGLGEVVLGCGEADTKSFGFSDAGHEAVADVDETVMLVGVHSQQWATNTTVFVNATGAVCSAAIAEGESAVLEMSEEFVPLRVSRLTVFLAGS
jgi:hypothetical protein